MKLSAYHVDFALPYFIIVEDQWAILWSNALTEKRVSCLVPSIIGIRMLDQIATQRMQSSRVSALCCLRLLAQPLSIPEGDEDTQ